MVIMFVCTNVYFDACYICSCNVYMCWIFPFSDPIKSPVIINVNRHPVDQIASIFKMRKYGDRQESLPSGTEVDVSEKCNMVSNACAMCAIIYI